MAETSGPFDAGAGQTLTEADWELMLDRLVDGVIGSPGSGALAATATGTRSVSIAAGPALARAHWYRNTSPKVVTSGANAAGSNRVDRAVLRVDRSANTVTIELKAGTAGAGTPALTDTSTVTERPLWRWTITPGATAVTGLTDERQWLGSLVLPCTSTNRPVSASPGQIGYETDTGRWIAWTGAAWVVFWDDTGWVNLTPNGPNAAAWTNNSTSRVRRVNGWTHLRFAIQRWATGSLPLSVVNGDAPFVLPDGFAPTVETMGLGYAPSARETVIAASVETSGTVRVRPLVADLPASRTIQVAMSWPVG